MGRADWHARIIRTDSSALSIVRKAVDALPVRVLELPYNSPIHYLRRVDEVMDTRLGASSHRSTQAAGAIRTNLNRAEALRELRQDTSYSSWAATAPKMERLRRRLVTANLMSANLC